jgi:hypothetical protein
MDLSALKAVLGKLEAADLAILEAELVPAILDLGVAALPAAYQPLVKGIEDALMPQVQAALTSLLAKIPQL